MMNGWLVIDKPEGMSSAHVVRVIKKITKAKKVGHAGTLDPLATGILPIALNEATKTAQHITAGEKAYNFTIKFGATTDTDDKEGVTTATTDSYPTKEEILKALPFFTGNIEQTPPVYSAIKVNGKRAYKLAREGQKITMTPRKIQISSLELIAMPNNHTAHFKITCSKGTYIRSLARDLSLKLGTYGHIIALRRTKVGPFHEKDTILLEKLEKMVQSAPPSEWLLPIETALADIPVLDLDHTFLRRLKNGQAVHIPKSPKDLETVGMYVEGKLVAIGCLKDSTLKPIRVFNE